MSETTTAAPAAAAEPAAAAPVEAPAAAEPKWESLGNVIGEAKPAPAEAAAADPAAPAEPAKSAEPAAPTEYKDLKVPDGIDAKAPAFEAFTSEAVKLGLTQDKAEALLASVAPKLAEQLSAPYKAWSDLQAKWTGEIKADPTFGGDKLTATVQSIAKLLDNPALCDLGLRQAMIDTGAGNNPAVYRSFAKLAAAFTEGTHVAGKPAKPAQSLAEQMYPSMVQSQSGT